MSERRKRSWWDTAQMMADLDSTMSRMWQMEGGIDSTEEDFVRAAGEALETVEMLAGVLREMAPKADAPEGWQPIETAPSWTPMLVYIPLPNGSEIDTMIMDGSGIFTDVRFAKWHWINPTHWMPLPAPPEVTE